MNKIKSIFSKIKNFIVKNNKTILHALYIVLGVVALDQLTKWLAIIFLEGEASFPLWQDVFHLTFVKNPGAAFGMLSNSRWVFMVTSTVAIVAVMYYLIRYRPTNKWLVWALSMIVGGGIGNMIDRCVLKYVIDMLDFRLINFAIFNVADSFVCVGVGLFALAVILEEIEAAKKDKAQKLASQVEENAEDNT